MRPIRIGIAASLVAAFLSAPAVAWAQGSQGGRWEIEGAGGLIWNTRTGDGDLTLPPPGLPIATTTPIAPSRQVPTWFFGDGASLLNSVLETFGLAPRIQPLDDAISRLATSKSTASVVSARVRRRINDKFAFEFSADVLAGSAGFSDEFIAALGATGDSFRAAFESLLTTGPITDISSRATHSASGGSTRELALTGLLVQTLGSPDASWSPYFTAGGGITLGTSNDASATIEGGYRFTTIGGVPQASSTFDETDRVTFRFDHRTIFCGFVYAGVLLDFSRRWGLRLGCRVYVGRNGETFEVC
jgi:hypothetical protein